MKKYSRSFENGNWFIYYDRTCGEVRVAQTYLHRHEHFFESKETAQQVINEIGEEKLKKYWFEVER